jgi:hypothetical protein
VPPTGVALANGLVTFAACIGMASTYVVFGMLIDRFGWPQAFLVTSGVTLLVALVWSLASSDHPPGVAAPDRSPSLRAGRFTALLGNRSLLCLTLSYGTVGYFQYLFFYWAQFYFEKVLEYPKEVGRRNASVLTLAMGAGMVLGGWLSDRAMARLGPRRGLAAVPVGGLLLGPNQLRGGNGRGRLGGGLVLDGGGPGRRHAGRHRGRNPQHRGERGRPAGPCRHARACRALWLARGVSAGERCLRWRGGPVVGNHGRRP